MGKKKSKDRRPAKVSPFHSDLEAFTSDLKLRGPSKPGVHACWSCGHSNEVLARVGVPHLPGLVVMASDELYLCRWCLPAYLNNQGVYDLVHHGVPFCEHDLIPIPMEMPECPCCIAEAGQKAQGRSLQ